MLPANAWAGEWWQGVWAWDKDWCSSAGQIGSVSLAPIAITDTEIQGYENTCQITGTQEVADLNAVALTLACWGEGESYDDARLIMRGEDAIWMWFGSDEPVQFHACNGKK